jgi:hypothetical protein
MKENEMNQLKRGMDAPGIVFGLILLAAGAYYMLRNTFGLPLDEIDWDRVWPFIVIALGGSVILKAWTQTKAA